MTLYSRPIPPAGNGIEGLTLSWVSSTTINIAPGGAIVQGGLTYPDRYSVYTDGSLTTTKRLDQAWAAGGTGGRLNGSLSSNAWYHVFLLYNPSTAQVDFGFDISINCTSRPAGWLYRLIGSIRAGAAGAIREFYQVGNRFDWYRADSVFDTSNLTKTTTNQVSLATLVPTGLECLAHLYIGFISSDNTPREVYLSHPAVVPTLGKLQTPWVSSNTSFSAHSIDQIADTNASIRFYLDATAATAVTAQIRVVGFSHPRA